MDKNASKPSKKTNVFDFSRRSILRKAKYFLSLHQEPITNEL